MVSYVLPLRSNRARDDLTVYLEWLADRAEVIVVDGSDIDVFEAHAALWREVVHHVAVDDDVRGANGKVAGVLTGLRLARYPAVVIADDDVRYNAHDLERMESLLNHADVVRPQNVFSEWPWHAWWDT